MCKRRLVPIKSKTISDQMESKIESFKINCFKLFVNNSHVLLIFLYLNTFYFFLNISYFIINQVSIKP